MKRLRMKFKFCGCCFGAWSFEIKPNGCTSMEFVVWVIVSTFVHTSKNRDVEFEQLYKTIVLIVPG